MNVYSFLSIMAHGGQAGNSVHRLRLIRLLLLAVLTLFPWGNLAWAPPPSQADATAIQSEKTVERPDTQNPNATVLQRSDGIGVDPNTNRGAQVRDQLGLKKAGDLLTPDRKKIPGASREGSRSPEFDTVQDELAKQKSKGTGAKGKYDLNMTGKGTRDFGQKQPSDRDIRSNRDKMLEDFTGIKTPERTEHKAKPDAKKAGASGGGDPRLGKYEKSNFAKFKTAVGKAWKAVGGKSSEKVGQGKKKGGQGTTGVRGTPVPDGAGIAGGGGSEIKEKFDVRKSLINPGDPDSGIGTTRPDSYREMPEKALENQLDPLILTDETFGAGPGSTSGGEVKTFENTLIDPPNPDSGVDTSTPPAPNPDGSGDGGGAGGGGE